MCTLKYVLLFIVVMFVSGLSNADNDSLLGAHPIQQGVMLVALNDVYPLYIGCIIFYRCCIKIFQGMLDFWFSYYVSLWNNLIFGV